MKQTLVLDGELIDEHTIHVEQAIKGILGKVKMVLEVPNQAKCGSVDEFENYFMNLNVDLSNFKFDRDEANER